MGSRLNLWGQAARTLSGEASDESVNAIEQKSHSGVKHRGCFCFPDTKNHLHNTLGKTKFIPTIFPCKISRQKSHPPGLQQPGLHTSSGSWTKRTHLCSNILAFVFNYLLTSPNAKYIIKQTQHRATSFEYVFVSFLVSDCLFICIYYSSKHWYLKLHVKRLNVNSYLSKRNTRILNFFKNPATI